MGEVYQCIGLDTLSWARCGAEVVGLDFGRPTMGPRHRVGYRREFEVRDCSTWAAGSTSSTPGSAPMLARRPSRDGQVVHVFVYLVEIHPFTDVFAKDRLQVAHHYFDRGVPFRDETPGTYADPNAITHHNLTYEWTHTIDSVLSSLLDAGLHLQSFSEHDFTVFRQFDDLVFDPTDRTFRFPGDHPRLPLMYSLRADAPDADDVRETS